MGKGYAEGPALDERLAAAEQGPAQPMQRTRKAVFGSTQKKRDRHFLGWLGEVDPDELFDSGEAWGLSVTAIAFDPPKRLAEGSKKPAARASKPAARPSKPAARPRKLAKAS